MKKATEAGLNQEQAAAFAESNVDTADSEIQTALDAAFKQVVAEAKGGAYAEGFDEKQSETRNDPNPWDSDYGKNITTTSVQKTYNQDYSVVVGKGKTVKTENRFSFGKDPEIESTFAIEKVAGYATPDKAVPTTGSAKYQGKAFSKDGVGDLNYTVNFDKRTGSGSITDIAETGRIDLAEGKLGKVSVGDKTVTGISAAASAETGSQGTYRLGLFGKAAEEIAGSANLPESEIGFGGKRGAIVSREEAERLAKRKTDLVQKGLDAGLNAQQAETFAENNLNVADNDIKTALDAAVEQAIADSKGGIYADGLSEQKNGTSVSSQNSTSIVNGRVIRINQTVSTTGFQKAYNQKYSIVVGSGQRQEVEDHITNRTTTTVSLDIDKVAGFATPEKAVPTAGTAEYLGKAFSKDGSGDLSYTINFDKRTGFGSITEIGGTGAISLSEGKLGKVSLGGKNITGIDAAASSASGTSGRYTLGLFGKAAEEIAGLLKLSDINIGFGGQRGEIKK